jgi:RHS repeat-associated protein
VVRGFTWQPDGTPATWTGPDATTWQITSSTAGATTTLTAGGGPGGSTRVDRAVAPDGTILAEHTTTPAGTSLLIDLGPIGRVTITTSPDSQETVTGQRDQRRPDGTLATTRTGPALADTTAFHTDTQGTPIAAAGTTMLDGTAPTGRRWWTAYGAPRGPPDTTSGPAGTGWLGRPQHPPVQDATGLTRLGARDHDPALGAFTSPDPVTAFGDPGSLDPYTYARWNPITSSDPSGLWPDWGKAKNTLAKAGAWAWKNKAAIAGAAAGLVVGAAACAVTAGLGCVLIGGALAGAAASATTYSVEAATGQRTWNTRDFLKTTATGAALGAAGGAAGRLAATAARAAATAARATMTRATQAASSALTRGAQAPRTAMTRGATTPMGPAAPSPGQQVFRVYGGDSPAGGASWSPVDPRTVPDFRISAGLPTGGASGAHNTGRFVIEGDLVDPSAIVTQRPALPLDGMEGGLPEYIIPGWLDSGAIRITRVSGVNPEF